MILASIPSPSRGVWHLGPLPLRAYALCIILGVFIAIWLGDKRWVARGGRPGTVADVSVWAIPFGLVGARLYHVITTPELYFGSGGHPVEALYIWKGGLGIWGAIGLGAVGAWIGCRAQRANFRAYADALAPGILLAQAIGRFGNYFNQELFGKPTTKPWGLEIASQHRPAGYEQYATFQPTFLYESIWNLAGVAVLLLADRRFRLGRGRVFALYVAVYCVGRFWIEALRIDDAHHILGLRLNDWTSILCFAGAVAYLVIVGRRHEGREEVVQEWDGAPGVAARAGTADGAAADGRGADGRGGDEPGGDEPGGDETAPDGRAPDDAAESTAGDRPAPS